MGFTGPSQIDGIQVQHDQPAMVDSFEKNLAAIFNNYAAVAGWDPGDPELKARWETGKQEFISEWLPEANTVLRTLNATCSRTEPAVAVELGMDGGGAFVYRCKHSPSHEWQVDGGKKIR
jgi:hypothetical protein